MRLTFIMRKVTLLALTLAAGAYAQPAAPLTFEVATVKAAAPPEPGQRMMMGIGGGPGSRDPGQITANGTTLKMLLMTAYDVKPYQINGPAWLDSERYDIIAKVPAGTTKDQAKVMWQNLLADRFGLTLHRESKIFPVEEMQIARGGPKLKETTFKETTSDPNTPESQPPVGAIVTGPGRAGQPGLPFTPPKIDKNGVPELPGPGLMMMMTMGPAGPAAHMVGKAQTTTQLAGMVGNELDRPVVDKTGLTGKYDFVLEFAPDPGRFKMLPGPGLAGPGLSGPGADAANATDPSGLTIVGALQQQLGLRLVSTKAPLDILIIDHAEKVPTEN
jgi:uncharacterized protein (TIGR03435 family)